MAPRVAPAAVLLPLLLLPLAAAARYEHALELVGLAAPAPPRDAARDAAAFVRLATAAPLSGGAGWVSVEVGGCAHPTVEGWWVGLYARDPSEAAPLKVRHLDASVPGFYTHGAANFTLRVTNHRVPLRLVLLRKGLFKPVVVATSERAVEFDTYGAPLGAHLSLLRGGKGLQVQWTTDHTCTSPRVRWGLSPESYDNEAAAATATYTPGDMCGSPAKDVGWVDPGLIHTAPMAGAQPGQTVYYVYGDESEGCGFGAEASYVVPPAAGATSEARLLLIADMGVTQEDGSNQFNDMPGPANVTRRLVAEAESGSFDPHALVHVGDLSYARGYGSLWDELFERVQPVATRVPYMAGIGNHERDWPGTGCYLCESRDQDSHGECGVPYEARFPMPTPARDSPWYSFDVGPVHMLVISTEHFFAAGSPQYAFVEADLKAVDRSVTPWVLFMGHRPFYVSSNNNEPHWGDTTVGIAMRKAFEGLWQEYGVDLTVAGHHHSYQRTCHATGGKCAPDGKAPVHLVIGNAGARYSPVQSPQPAVFECTHLIYGYARLRANATHLTTEAVAGSDGRVFDTLTLVKPPAAAAR